jgi:hypothetical protein
MATQCPRGTTARPRTRSSSSRARRPTSPQFVPPQERATFDQDGTLWVEHPIYTQVVFCFDRVPAVVKAQPDLAGEEPFMTVLSGNEAAIANLSMDDLLKIVGGR